jgi:hypothetical protein
VHHVVFIAAIAAHHNDTIQDTQQCTQLCCMGLISIQAYGGCSVAHAACDQ